MIGKIVLYNTENSFFSSMISFSNGVINAFFIGNFKISIKKRISSLAPASVAFSKVFFNMLQR